MGSNEASTQAEDSKDSIDGEQTDSGRGNSTNNHGEQQKRWPHVVCLLGSGVTVAVMLFFIHGVIFSGNCNSWPPVVGCVVCSCVCMATVGIVARSEREYRLAVIESDKEVKLEQIRAKTLEEERKLTELMWKREQEQAADLQEGKRHRRCGR